MKHFYTFLFFLLTCTLRSLAQVNDSTSEQSEMFKVVEEIATYPGGIAKFYEFIGNNLKYPKQAKRAGLKGKVFVEFVINADGSIDDNSVRALTEDQLKKTYFDSSNALLDSECQQEAVRVIKACPNWIPGTANGKAVRQRYTLPIQFMY